MSTGWIILISVVVVLIAAAAFAQWKLGGVGGLQSRLGGLQTRFGGGGLKRRFGPEYERTVAEHGGDQRAAEKELEERLRLHGKLRPTPLAPEKRERYAAEWSRVQEEFVTSPPEAVTGADRLLANLLRDRGFPSSGFDEQVAALSVREPGRVHAYREVHAAAGDGGQAGTEELRQTLLQARDLFDTLIERRTTTRHDGGERAKPARALAERIHIPWPGKQHETRKGATT